MKSSVQPEDAGAAEDPTPASASGAAPRAPPLVAPSTVDPCPGGAFPPPEGAAGVGMDTALVTGADDPLAAFSHGGVFSKALSTLQWAEGQHQVSVTRLQAVAKREEALKAERAAFVGEESRL